MTFVLYTFKQLIMRKKILILGIIILLFNSVTLAHPHVFLSTYTTFVFDMEGNITGIKAKWIFDENFSATIKLDYDKDKDGKFSKTEIETLKNEAFAALKDHNYFTYIESEGDKYEVNNVRQFSSKIKNGKVEYSFFIPFKVEASDSYKKITVLMYDKSYYIALSPAEKGSVLIRNSMAVESTYRKYEDLKSAYYYNQINPIAVELKYRKAR